ncbi:AraC family transcriptional regulator [Treponema parvum]|uniref:AraC family transcriptional regulator n=1 Tax=Treponema parvum TaxID=138851 RepID=A0A975IFP1_9SPIR|nr:AraC family transcriptional regulator [Treponema parvum]
MNMLNSFNRTMDYIESVLDGEIDEKEVTRISHYSFALFSRLFSILTGYTLSEYVRFRKLSRAAADLRNTNEKVIDIALKYGYESPDSFAAAFKKFHDASPSEIKEGKEFTSFLPLRLSLTVTGGNMMKVKIEKKAAFTVAGLKETVSATTDFPSLWKKLYSRIPHSQLAKLGNGQSFGVCTEVSDCKDFTYMAAYDLRGASCREKAGELGLSVLEIPQAEYAVVTLEGAVPDCIHAGWKFVMENFFPEHGFRHAGSPDFEVYAEGDMDSPAYKMELWVPIVKE